MKISPVARKIAEKAGLDLKQLKGTGPGGRIVKDDVTKALAEQKKIKQSLFRSRKRRKSR